MKRFLKPLSLFLAIAAIAGGGVSPVAAATITGTVSLRIFGTLRGALTQNGQVTCSGAVALSPDTTSGTLTIANIGASLLSQSAVQTGGVKATLNATRTAFTCIVPLPFTFLNVNPGEKLIVSLDVRGSDPGYLNPATGVFTPPTTVPGRTRQVVTIIDAINQTTSIPVAPAFLNVKL